MRQALAAAKNNNFDLAKSLYLESGAYLDALQLIGKCKNGRWEEEILEILGTTPNNNAAVINAATMLFEDSAVDQCYMAELYSKTNDYNKLLQLHILSQNWIEANQIFEEYEHHMDSGGMLCYANILVTQGHIEKALQVYCKTGRLDIGYRVMNEVSESAAIMEDYKNASHSLWVFTEALRESENVRAPMYVTE